MIGKSRGFLDHEIQKFFTLEWPALKEATPFLGLVTALAVALPLSLFLLG